MTTRYEISVQGRVVDASGKPMDADLLDQHLDDVSDQLADLEADDDALSDFNVSAKLASGEVEVSVVVEAENPLRAAKKGNAAIRCAVHAAGGFTPGWDQAAEESAEQWALEYEASSQRRLEPAAVG